MTPMKTKVATAISIVGVLGAGSAAALVNTQILDNGPSESGASAAVLPEPESIDLTVPVETIPVARVLATTTTLAPETTSTTTMAPAPAPSGMLTAFNVGDAGVVTVDVIDGQLVLVSAEPKDGWSVTKAEDDSNDDSDEIENEVEVEFRSATVRVEFEATLVDGQIVPKVESYAIGAAATPAPAPAAPNTTQAPSNTYHDDDHYEDDDDHYEDDDDHYEDHDDDHYEDRDDD